MSMISPDMVDSIRNFSYILGHSAYYTSSSCNSVFKNTHAIPVIDTSKTRRLVPEKFAANRKIGINIMLGVFCVRVPQVGERVDITPLKRILQRENADVPRIDHVI